jgi:hypothetical protein
MAVKGENVSAQWIFFFWKARHLSGAKEASPSGTISSQKAAQRAAQ